MSFIPEKFLWILQRLSAIFIFLFFIWFIYSINTFELNNYNETVKWIKSDKNAILLFLFSIIVFLHANLGLSVIIDDYVHNIIYKKLFFIIKNTLILFSVVFSGICLYLI